MFYLTTHSTHFIYGYMASDIWLRTILIVRKKTRCCHIGYSFRLTARVLLYAPSHRQDSTYHGLCTPVVEHCLLSMGWCIQKIPCWYQLHKHYLKSNHRNILATYKKHFITTHPHTYDTNDIQDFVKCCITSWVHPTFNLRTCCLVDYNLLYFRHVSIGPVCNKVGDWR